MKAAPFLLGLGIWTVGPPTPHTHLDFMPFSFPPNLGFIPQLPGACSQRALVALSAPAGAEL